MKLLSRVKATVLIYTMVLVVLGVFMATVVLNIAMQLSSEYEIRNIELSLRNIIQAKGDLAIKYARDTNNTGSGFVDIIGCPTSVTMSGSTFATNMRFLTGVILCEGSYTSNSVKLYFNTNYTDIQLAEYLGSQISVNSGTTTGTFPDGTSFNFAASYPLLPDGIDDNFDSDNYSAYSTGTILYPDGYSDNDDESRRMLYGYIIEDSGLYNVLWTNTKMKNYISVNPANLHPSGLTIGSSTGSYLYLDIDTSFKLMLYRLDKNAYDASKELVITQRLTGTWEIASIGYLQNDLSLSPIKTGTGEYLFDFVNHDYALFIENTSSWALLYQIRGEHATSGTGLYMNPLKDQDISLISYFGNHVFIDDEGKLIADQYEISALK